VHIDAFSLCFILFNFSVSLGLGLGCDWLSGRTAPDRTHFQAPHPTAPRPSPAPTLHPSPCLPPQIVGVVGLFFAPIPLLMKQGYLVWTGIITAFIFTYIPEWTSWVLLGLMAIYDLIAVLVPGGPLKVRGVCGRRRGLRGRRGRCGPRARPPAAHGTVARRAAPRSPLCSL
jgi:hypothetical protein